MDQPPERLTNALADRYRIESEIGSGGMATVYLAQDLKHDRKVAVKVLKPELAAVLGAERFLSEIKTTANLQHPHILALYDSGEADSFLFYVMPFIEGESLREKLDREKQLSVEEAVGITKAVANALDYAHRHGVIHRDIKPANILLHDGQPMVADFGIALAVRAAGGARLTETGLSLGTPQYMSPEQASGDREVDGRTDIYSLGAVLYEMLTGEPPHAGPTVQAIIAKLLTDKPRPVTELRETVPPQVAASLHKALEKLPADRIETAGRFAETLSGQAVLGTSPTSPSSMGDGERTRGLVSKALPWALAAVLLAIVATQGLRERLRRADLGIVSTNITLPDSIPLAFVGEAWQGIALPALDLSPDGKTIVYVGQVGESTRLFVRRLDSFEVTALPGTDGAGVPSFSADGEWIAFAANGRLHRVSLNGERPIPITEAEQPYGFSWNDSDEIVSVIQDSRTLMITGPTGADESRRAIGLGMASYVSAPRWLPRSEWLLGTCYSPCRLCAISSKTLEFRNLMERAEAGDPEGTPLDGTNPRFVEPGFLVFGDPGTNKVMAARFDPERMAVLSDPLELFDGIRREASHGGLQMAVSASGDMVYAPGEDAFRGQLVWAAPGGVRDTLPFDPDLYGPFYLSPDASRIAALITSELGDYEVWFLDIDREDPTRWNPDRGGGAGTPYYGGWLPDNHSSVVTLVQGDTSELVLVDALEPNGGTPLWRGKGMVAGYTFYEDGTGLFTVYGSGGSYPTHVQLSDLPNLPSDATEAFPDLLDRTGGEAFPSISPDGQWMIYNSDPEGHWELYAQRVGSETPALKISTDGADIGRWTAQGDGLYFRNGRSFYWVALTGDPEKPFSDPEFYLKGNFLNVPGPELAVHPDGKRLLLLEGTPTNTTTELRFVQNWTQILEERLGGGG